jgi:hypothetical protein
VTSVYIAIPLPAFHRWRLLASAADCPGGYAIIGCVHAGRRASLEPTAVTGARITLRSELSELVALYASLTAADRSRLVQYGRDLLNAAENARDSQRAPAAEAT